MHNIAEGCDAGTDPEFIRFLKMSRRSASEVQSELYLALDRKYMFESDRKLAYDQADEVKRLINGLIGYLRKNGTIAGNKIGENQADYLSDTLSQGAFPDDYQTNDY